MSRVESQHEIAVFTCNHCRHEVTNRATGTRHRNHCPRCLWSVHLDHKPGDRRCDCKGAMRPIAVEVKPDGEWAIVHRCTMCNALRTNRIAGDDDERALIALALRAVQRMPFPLENGAI